MYKFNDLDLWFDIWHHFQWTLTYGMNFNLWCHFLWPVTSLLVTFELWRHFLWHDPQNLQVTFPFSL
jgi:hypothetical protein